MAIAVSDVPTFTVFCGPMFGGKTSKLLVALERFKYQHKRIAVFKPNMDDRYSIEDVVSHSGWKVPALTVKVGADILELLAESDENPHVIAVDEAFMIPGIAEVLTWLYRNGFTIVVSTLDLSATGKPFHEVEKMLPWATHVEKCSAVCTVCGSDALYTHKKQLGGDEIEVGGGELYEPRCVKCHPFILNHELVTKPPQD
jgi:thymidine kinase